MLRKLAIAITASSVTLLNTGYALGLGDIQMNSALNQPLNARIDLLDAEGIRFEDIRPRLANQDAFARAGIRRDPFYTNIRFEVVQSSSGQPQILLFTTQPVVEPFLNFLVEVVTPSRSGTGIIREYTVLVDPVSVQGRTAPVAPSAPVARQAEPRVTPAQPQPTTRPQPSVRSESLPAGQVRVQQNDTLGAIARRNLPSGVTLDQMMLAIQDQNPDAFLRDNINLIKAGSIIRMPSAEQARVRSAAEARSEVAAQHEAFRTRNFAPRAQAPAAQVASAATSESQVRATGELSIVAETGDGSALGVNADLADLENQLALNTEESDRLQRENELLNSRLQELESQLQMMQRIIDLRSETGAALVDQLQQQDEQAMDAPLDDEGVQDVLSGLQAAEQAEAADSALAQEAEPAAVEPTPEPSPVVAPEPVQPAPQAGFLASIQAWLTSSMVNLGIAIAAIALLLIGLLAMLGRRKQQVDDLQDLEDLEPLDELNEPELDTPLEDLEPEPIEDTEFDSYSSPASDAHNPLSDAEMYLAYGHYDQALNELQQAEDRGVDVASVAEKRLEVYAEAGRREDFEQYAKTVVAIVSAASLASLRERLAQNAPMDDDISDFDMGVDLNQESDQEHSNSMDFETNDDLNAAKEDDNSMAFDLDSDLDLADEQSLDLNEVEDQASKPFDLDAFTDTANSDEISLDLDFSLDEEQQPEQKAEADTDLEPASDNDTGIEFNLDGFELPEDESSNTEPSSSQSAAMDMLTMDLQDKDSSLDSADFDLPELEDSQSELSEPAPEGQDLDDSSELNLESWDEQEVDLELPADPEQAMTDDVEPDDLQLADDDFGILSTTDEVATKLDLAQAYIDMEDQEAARDLLQEVLVEGDGEQKAKAEQMLADL